MAEGRRMATDCRHARQLAFIGATGISGAWKVQVCGATWCMVALARAIYELLPSVRPGTGKGRPSFGRSAYGKPRRGPGAPARLARQQAAGRTRSVRSVNDDGGAGGRPVPQPHHVAVGDVHAAVGAVVLAVWIVVRILGARSVVVAPVGVVNSVTP